MGVKGVRETIDDDVKFYTPKELAEMWGCSRQHIHNLIYRGLLPARKMGRKVIILKKDLANYLDSLPYVRQLRTD
ncbi:helix-turn-helix domain-containing protein [Hydrogenivirga sp.]